MHLPTILFLGPALVCAAAWLGAGLLVPRRLDSGEGLLDVLTRVGAGSVVCSLAVLGLGRVGALDRTLIVVLTFVGACAGLLFLRRIGRAVRAAAPVGRLERALFTCVAIALVLDLVASTAPVTSADALKYHLALPKLWLQNGSIGDPFWRWEGFNPAAIEMLYTQGLALGGGSAAAPLHAIFAVLCAFAVFGLGRALAGPLAGAVGAFLFILQGIVTWEATSSFVELGLTFYIVLAVWHGVHWARSPTVGSAIWIGFFAGAAAGTKYNGLVAAAIVLAAGGVVAAARRRGADVAFAGCAAVCAGGAWYLKNVLVTGNPVYPFIFGGKWLSASVDSAIRQTYDHYGVGGGVARLALLPADLIVHGEAFDRGRYVSTAIFLLALLAVVTCRTPVVYVLAGGVVAYVIFWHAQSPQARFLLPALAVLAVLGGVVAAPWLRAGGPRQVVVGLLLAGSAAVWLASSVALTRQLIPVTVGAESRSAALERLTGTYDAYRAARARVGPGTVALVDYPFTFNFPGRAVTLDIPEFTPSLPRATFTARLHSLEVQAVLVGGGPDSASVLRPLGSCLRQVGVYHARFVTSRSLGESIPYDLTLFSTAGCR